MGGHDRCIMTTLLHQAGVNILSLSKQLMIGIVIDFRLPSEKFLKKEYQKSEKLRWKKNSIKIKLKKKQRKLSFHIVSLNV